MRRSTNFLANKLTPTRKLIRKSVSKQELRNVPEKVRIFSTKVNGVFNPSRAPFMSESCIKIKINSKFLFSHLWCLFMKA